MNGDDVRTSVCLFLSCLTDSASGKGGVFFILNGGLTGEAAGTFVAVLELLRRAQWTFLRLENEYLNNSARYRSVVAAPMLLDDVGSSNWDSEWKFEKAGRGLGCRCSVVDFICFCFMP